MKAIVIGTFVLVIGIIGYLVLLYRASHKLVNGLSDVIDETNALIRSGCELHENQNVLTESLLKTSDSVLVNSQDTRDQLNGFQKGAVTGFQIYLVKNGWGIYRIDTKEPFDGTPFSITDDYFDGVPPRSYDDMQKVRLSKIEKTS